MEETGQPDGLNGPLRRLADPLENLVARKAKDMKLEKITLPAAIATGHSMTRLQGTDSDGNVTRCICGFVHDDGYMICCDQCSVWQHVICVCVNPGDPPPDNYLCDICDPRHLDCQRARALQKRKLEEMADHMSTNSDESAEESGSVSPPDFSSKLCESIVHDHLSSTCLSTPFTTPGVKQRVRKSSLSRSLRLQKAHSWDHSQSFQSVLDPTQLQKDNILREQTEHVPCIIDLPRQSPHSLAITDPWDFRNPPDFISGNKYSAEVQGLVESIIQKNLHTSLCEAPTTPPVQCLQHSQSTRRSLVCGANVNPNTFLQEFQGYFQTQASFERECGTIPWRNNLCPHILFFQLCGLKLCIDARENGNVCRFVRRSCSPTAVVHCYINNGELRVGIFSRHCLSPGIEITIPFDFDYQKCNFLVECPCSLAVCPVQLSNKVIQQRLQSIPYSIGETSGGGLVGLNHDGRELSISDQTAMQPRSPRKMTMKGNHLRGPKRRKRRQSDGVILARKEGDVDSDGLEFDCFEQEKKKNLTREERKLEAIMKAFEKMEKDEKRKRETSCSGKCSGGASPEGEEKKSSGRGRKIGQMGRKKPGRKRRSVPGLNLESLSPDNSSNLTATPPATPVDIISPFVTPLMNTPVHTPVGSAVKLPRKKCIVYEWMNQVRLSGSAFAVITQEISAAQSHIENEDRDKEANVIDDNATGLFSRLGAYTRETADGLPINDRSNHSMSNGIALKQEIKREEGYEQNDHQSLTYSTNAIPSYSPVSPQIRASDPRKALANFWSSVSTSQDMVNPARTDLSSPCTKKADSPALCIKKRWLQMARPTTATQTVTSSYLSTCSDTTRTESVPTSPLTASPTIRHDVSTSVVDGLPSAVTSSSCTDQELGGDVRDQGGKGGKRKVSLWEYRNRKRDVVPVNETERSSSRWLSDSIRSSQSSSVSTFGVTHMFDTVTKATNSSGIKKNHQLHEPCSPPDMPVIEPVTPEGYQSDGETTNQSQFGDNYFQWEKETLKDRKLQQLDWSSNQLLPIIKPPKLPDLPPLPSTPPPPPPPEDISIRDFPPPVSQQIVSSQFPWTTTYSIINFQRFPQQQGLPFVPSSHGRSWPPTQYTLGVTRSNSFPTANPNGPY